MIVSARALAIPIYGFEDFPGRFAAWLGYLSWTPPGIEAATGPDKPIYRALVSKWQRGEVSPSVTSLAKVAGCIGVSARELFDETPWERVGRALAGNAAPAEGLERARLGSVVGVDRRDFVAAVNRVPAGALPLFGPNPAGIAESLEPDNLPMLLQLPIFDVERYPMVGDGRRATTVLAGLERLGAELRLWRYSAADRALVTAAIEELELLVETEAV
jgi:hypothetical protein